MKPQAELATTLLERERANQPQTEKEIFERLAHVLRNLEFYLPNHKWDYTLYWGTDPSAWARIRRGELRASECGTIGCARGIAEMLWPDATLRLLGSRDENRFGHIFAYSGEYSLLSDVPIEELIRRLETHSKEL